MPHRVLVRPHLPSFVGELGRVVVAGLDGLLVGLTVGYIALTALGAPAFYLGLHPLVEILLVGAVVTLVAVLGGAIAVGAVAVVVWLGHRGTRWLETRGHRRLAAIAGWPFRIIDGLPAGWMGAFAVLLWIALIGRTTGPLGLLTPPGILSTFVYLAGLIGALLFAARAIATPAIATPARHVRRGSPGRVRRSLAGIVVIVAALVAFGSVAYAAFPGSTTGLVAYDPSFDGDPAVVGATLAGRGFIQPDDPGEPGPFAVERLSYGSGSDARRPAFGTDADLLTPTVDASSILPTLDGGADAVRAAWWGFGTDALPLDGLVWAPVGPGPFPLVLIVHGNHAMGDFSEDGYAYLAEHLATRGFIAVSIDEDFLNGSWAGEWQGNEQLARAWLLLLHADQWRTWDADPASPFHDRVDLDRIALIGHSRGGEAASVAAMLAADDVAPRASITPWPTGLEIAAVVSIAPSDGQYQRVVVLDGVDFLTLAGGHDSDARAWSGIRQYGRTRLDANGFKAALWSYRANHGQFNTVWGRSDFGPYGGAQLNLAPLLAATDQEDVARTAIGAFLEASLHDRAVYRGFFARPMVGRDWLPQDIYLVRSAEGTATDLATGAPDRPIDGLHTEATGFESSDGTFVPLRALQPHQGDRAVLARWTAAADGTDAIWGLDGLATVDVDRSSATMLRFALADGSSLEDGPRAPLAISIEALDADGTVATVPLASLGALPPPLPVVLAKDDRLMAASGIDIHLTSPAEVVLQTYTVPLASFEAADPAFRAEDLTGFRLRIGRGTAGAVWIGDVALGG